MPSPKKAEIRKYFILSYLNKHPSQLQVVLQEHLHQDTLPRQTEPPFVEQLNVFGQCHSAGGIVFWASKPEKGNETWVLYHFLSTVSFCKTTWRWLLPLDPTFTGLEPLWHCFILATTKVIDDTFLWGLLLFCRLVICLVPSFEMIGEIRCAAAVLDLRFFLLSRQSLQCTKLLSISSPETRHLK